LAGGRARGEQAWQTVAVAAVLWPKMQWDGVCVGQLRDNQIAPRLR
jgi:hypothetical protein